MKIKLPYGKTVLEGDIPEQRLSGIIKSRLDEYLPELSEWDTVAESIKNPIGSPSLRELAKGKNKVVLIASDHTRPVPSKIIVPQMLAEIREGNPDADITILIATGCHRQTTEAELEAKFGPEIVKSEKIVIHDCQQAENMVHFGTLPGGGELIINRLAAEADLLVSEGFIEPHFFAGFSGGRKSILPGIASQKTVYANHCAEFIDSPFARTGIIDGNPIHKDMIFAARTAKLAFIVNVVINSEHKVIASFAGDCNEAHVAGTEFLADLCRSDAILSDIVISTNNGYPLDQNIYQAVKGMCTAEATVKRGGVIIMVAACEDGCGGDAFYKTFAEDPDDKHILDEIRKVPADETIADQWQSQIFARILAEQKVIFISKSPKDIVRALHMIPADSLEQALSMADEILGYEGSITVIPEGISCIIA